MYNKKIIGVLTTVLFLVIIVIGLCGCLEEKSKFIGTWQYSSGGTITFNTDNTVNIDNIGPLVDMELIGVFDYSIANNQITFNSGSVGVILNYSFTDSNILILSNDAGFSITLTKI